MLELENEPVLRGLADGHPVVFLFAADPQKSRQSYPASSSRGHLVEYCAAPGATCCNATKGVMVVNATYNGQNGYVNTLERCYLPE